MHLAKDLLKQLKSIPEENYYILSNGCNKLLQMFVGSIRFTLSLKCSIKSLETC